MKKRGTLLVVIALVVGTGGIFFWLQGAGEETKKEKTEFIASKFDPAEHHEAIAAFCGDCHGMPDPNQFPKGDWDSKVELGFNEYNSSGRTDLEVPPRDVVLKYFVSQAPESLEFPKSSVGQPEGPVRFKQTKLDFPFNQPGQVPAVANIRTLRKPNQLGLSMDAMIACDMRTGLVAEFDPLKSEDPVLRHIHLRHPARATLVDFNDDGKKEFVVAGLGTFLPGDHKSGRVVWLQADDEASYEVTELLTGLGRVADVEPGDFDSDGDVDLLVAEFGWLSTGRVFIMDNKGNEGPVPEFEIRVLDDRHGCIQTPVVDLNGDGHLDFVAVFAQEHEVVEAFYNRGNGTFRRQFVFDSGSPSFGSSGVEVVDMDRDGDLDILYTNGDMLDGFYVVPYHGIHWFENTENGWKTHEVVSMPGAYRAEAADLDMDGDIDIVACALVPEQFESGGGKKHLDSVIWLEQTKPGEFKRHPLEADQCYHVTLELADFDRDGDTDIAIGEFRQRNEGVGHVRLWWNQTAEERKVDSGKTTPIVFRNNLSRSKRMER